MQRTKRILIVAAHDKKDEEIKGMAQAIHDTKASKGHEVTLVTCDNGKLDELQVKSANYDEVILCAHGRYYGKNNLNKPGPGLFDRNKRYDEGKATERHIAEQSFHRVADFLEDVIVQNRELKSVKLVVCESTLNRKSKNLKKATRDKNPELLPGSKPRKAVINPQVLEKDLFEKDGNVRAGKNIDDYSNLELLIGLIGEKYSTDKRVNVKDRIVNFRGINGVGYLSEDNTKVRAFDQKNIGLYLESKDDKKTQGKKKKKITSAEFEQQYVEGYELIPKIEYPVKLVSLKPTSGKGMKKQ